MSATYEDLDLDDILEIARTDSNNSWQIQQQASAVNELVSALADCVSGSHDAHAQIDGRIAMASDRPPIVSSGNPIADMVARAVNTVMGVMESASTNAASNQTRRLVESGFGNLVAMNPQADVFSQIATQTGEVYDQLVTWRQQRDEDIALAMEDPENPDLVASYDITDPTKAVETIREFHNQQARDRMATAATYYSDAIGQLEVPIPYDGPRVPSPNVGPTGPGNPGGNGVHTQPGPPLTRDLPPPPAVTVPSTPDVPDVTVPEGPDLQGPGVQVPIHNPGVPTPPVGSVPPPSTGVVPPGMFVPTRPVTPPVIGNRPPGLGPRSAFTPNRTGLTRPVIGGRPGANPGVPPRGMPGGRGMTPPVRGGAPGGRGAVPPGGRGAVPAGRGGPRAGTPRGGVPGGRGAVPPGGRGGTPGRAGPTKAGTPTPRRSFAQTANPGTRAKPAVTPKTGPVQGRKTPKTPAKPAAARGTRVPKVHHGGNDPNRPIIGRRGSKKKQSDEELTGRAPGEKVENEWFDTSGTVAPIIGRKKDTDDTDHDPGDFVTRHNLGRRNWTV